MDNLTAQQSSEFKEAVSSHHWICWFGLPNGTDLWQVVDAGIDQLLKTFTSKEQDKWVMNKENADKWYGHTEDKKLFTGLERRILITNWCGEVWKKVNSGDYNDYFKKCWETTGCLITADRSKDDKIKPEGLPSYKVPPPIDYIEAMTTTPVSSNVPEMFAVFEEVKSEVETEEDNEEPADEGEIQLDKEEDQTFVDEIVGLKVKVLYEHGWSIGEVMYYNKALMEYKISYSDGTDDFIPEDEMGSAEVQIVM